MTMANTIEIKVPDIGGHDSVPVIEVLVKVGDTVATEQSLITLESDKATMEIPSSAAGVIRELKLKVGDEVSEGAVIAVLETDGAAVSPSPSPASGDDRKDAGGRAMQGAIAEGRGEGAGSPGSPNEEATKSSQPPASTRPSPQSSLQGREEAKAPQAAAASSKPADIECQLVVLGSGPGGYSAAFRAADLGVDTVLVERYGTLGGVCLNVGCIPSKALLHAAAVIDEAEAMAAHGVSFSKPKIELDKLRKFKEQVVGKLTGGLAGMAKQRKVRTVQGTGMFVSPHEMEVQTARSEERRVGKECRSRWRQED